MVDDKPKQNPDYVKETLSRRGLIRRLATVAGLGTAAGYLALAPENWPFSMKDQTGLRSKPIITPLKLTDFRVEKPAMVSDVAVGRGPNVEERLRKALDAIGGLTHYVNPGDIVLLVAFGGGLTWGASVIQF